MKNILTMLFISLLFAGCATKNDSKTLEDLVLKLNSGDSIKIINQFPSPETTLKVGEEITISIEVEYTLTSESNGDVTLVVQDASNNFIANEFYVAQKGTHNEKLEATFIVPDTRAVVAFTPLTAGMKSSTIVVQSISYKVEK